MSQTLLPPTLLAYVVAIFLQNEITNLYRHLVTENPMELIQRIGALGFQRLMIPVQLLSIVKQWWLWACYCFALIGICTLIGNIYEGKTDENVFTPIREHPGRFLKSVTLFFGMLVVAYGALVVIIIGITDIQLRFTSKFPGWESPLVAFVGIGLVSAVLVRWAFTVPLVTLLGLPFRRALAVSDRVTDHRTVALWVLIVESEVSGYLALNAPSWALSHLRVDPTMLSYYGSYAAALILSALTQAPLMVAVGLVLAKCKPQFEGSVKAGFDV